LNVAYEDCDVSGSDLDRAGLPETGEARRSASSRGWSNGRRTRARLKRAPPLTARTAWHG